MVLAVLSEILSVVFHVFWPCIETSEKRTVARCKHVIFCCGSVHCFCSRYFHVSATFFMGPGLFLILVLYCSSIGSVVGTLHDGGLSTVFPLLADEDDVASFVIMGRFIRDFPSAEGLPGYTVCGCQVQAPER